jgi:type IV pilus assembly protein PilQ
VATLRGDASDQVVETSKGLVWTVVAGETERHAADEAPPIAAPAAAQAAGFGGAAPDYALLGAPGQKQYTGQRITLDFHDIDVRNLLRLLADVSKKNIVVADDVGGKITVALRNVPWDQALDIVLTSKGLGKQEVGNVIRVAKYEVIAKEEAAKLEAAKNRQVLLPLKVRIIPVNFSTATDLARQVKDVLSDRGTVTVDDRTNVLIVKDTQEALARAEGLVRNLDTETPGVLIESRIVEAASNFTQALGVQWGGNFGFSPATGNGLPVSFPNVMTGTGGSGGGPTTGVGTTPNYAVNLPAPIGQGSGGGIGLVFGSANGAFNLNLRLTALERKGVIKTISAPKVATLDNKEATISQGQSIPFSQVSASGVNTTFVEALLELKVTPHVTADGSILMKIKATNNKPDPSLTGANGQPSITKRQAETTVLVKDGDTTVIGGIYTRATSSTTNSVPFLGDIPILGFFFRSKAENDDHTELLIFITPRVLTRQSMAATSAPAAN